MSVISQQLSEKQLRDSQTAGAAQVPDWSEATAKDWERQLTLLSQGNIDPQQRRYWMVALRDWININIRPQEKTLDSDLTTISFSSANLDYKSVQRCLPLMRLVAYQLCDWGFIIELHQLLTSLNDRVSSELLDEAQTVEYLQLSVAYWQMGLLSEAEQWLQSIETRLSQDNPLRDFHYQIDQDIARFPPQLRDLVDDDIQLLPIEEQHLSSFSWVYHDPQIARLCNLPVFDSDDKWFDWLASNQTNQHKTLLAVNHRKWGFIGSVFLEVHQGVGFFYYWLGADFQGLGFGPRAVKLLLQFGQQKLGMTSCYAKAYEDNIASHHAMKKIGFESLPFKLAEPYQNEMYFYLGGDEDKASSVKALPKIGEELQRLIKAMGLVDVVEV